MGSVAASGGYYVACAAERIYANPGTLTGSIGVIFQLPYFEELMRWAKVDVRTLKAGALKDSGSPYREMTPEERTYFEGMLTDVHDQFIEAVAQGRGLKADEVRPYADGRVFTGRQGKEWKLVDELGGFQAAVAEAAKLGKISGEPKLEYPKKERNFFEELTGQDLESASRSVVRGALPDVFSGGLQFRLP
jgi:protease-4